MCFAELHEGCLKLYFKSFGPFEPVWVIPIIPMPIFAKGSFASMLGPLTRLRKTCYSWWSTAHSVWLESFGLKPG